MTVKGFTFDIRLTSAVWFCVRHKPTYGAWGETSYLPLFEEGKRPGENVWGNMSRGKCPTLYPPPLTFIYTLPGEINIVSWTHFRVSFLRLHFPIWRYFKHLTLNSLITYITISGNKIWQTLITPRLTAHACLWEHSVAVTWDLRLHATDLWPPNSPDLNPGTPCSSVCTKLAGITWTNINSDWLKCGADCSKTLLTRLLANGE